MSDLTAHWRMKYENKYLGAWDLWNAERKIYGEARVRIDAVTDDVVIGEGGRKSRPIQLHLVGRSGKRLPTMIVTRTTGTTLQIMFGESPAGWVGKEITIYVRKNAKAQRGTGDVLSIRNASAGNRLKDQLREEAPRPEVDATDLDEAQERQPGED